MADPDQTKKLIGREPVIAWRLTEEPTPITPAGHNHGETYGILCPDGKVYEHGAGAWSGWFDDLESWLEEQLMKAHRRSTEGHREV